MTEPLTVRACSVCRELFTPSGIRSSRCPVCRKRATEEWLAQKDEANSGDKGHLRLLRATGRLYG